MKTMTTNEAAERLYALFAPDVVLEAEVNAEVERIKAEGAREAVERIRQAIAKTPGSGGLTWAIQAILDEEAAR